MPTLLELTHRLRVHAPEFDNDQLEDLAENALDALESHAYGCALGPVAGIETDNHVVELVFQTIAPNASTRARKMTTIYEALERHLPATVSEPDAEQVRDIVAA